MPCCCCIAISQLGLKYIYSILFWSSLVYFILICPKFISPFQNDPDVVFFLLFSAEKCTLVNAEPPDFLHLLKHNFLLSYSHLYVSNMIINAGAVTSCEHQKNFERLPTWANRNITVGRVKQWRQAHAASQGVFVLSNYSVWSSPEQRANWLSSLLVISGGKRGERKCFFSSVF